MAGKFQAVIVTRNTERNEIIHAFTHRHLTEKVLKTEIGERFTEYEGDEAYVIQVYRGETDIAKVMADFAYGSLGEVVTLSDEAKYTSCF